MTELNAEQKNLLSYIDEYRNLLKSIAKEKKNYFDTLENYRFNQDFWDIYQSKEDWVNRWLKVVSQEEREWVAQDFISALYDSNAPKQVIAVVKKANAVLSDLMDFEGFEKCRKNRIFSDKQNDILHEADCILSKWQNEILKDVPSNEAKNKTNSIDPAKEQKKEEQPKTKMSKSAHALAVLAGTKQTKTEQKNERNMLMKAVRTSKEIWEAIKSEYDIKRPEFGKKINFVKDRFKRKIIFRDLEQAFQLASQGFSKPSIILAGGIIEEMLRLYLENKHIKMSSDRFADYIRACEDNHLLKRGVLHLSDSVRDFRNLVHLAKETEKKHTITMATAKGAVSSIFTIANDFQ